VSQVTHEGPGHEDVTLGLSFLRPDGGRLHQSWTVCACSPLLGQLGCLLGSPEHETVASPEAVRATVEAVMGVPGAIHTGEGFGS
jgi:hypothetical protein